MWVDIVPDDCKCHWVNYSDNGGWELRNRNRNCPHHGDNIDTENKEKKNDVRS